MGPKGGKRGKLHVSGQPNIPLRADGACSLFFMDFETATTKKGSRSRFAQALEVRNEDPTTRQASGDVYHRRQGHSRRSTANHDDHKAENEDIERSKFLHELHEDGHHEPNAADSNTDSEENLECHQ